MATYKRCNDCGRVATTGYMVTVRGRVCRDRDACLARASEQAGQTSLMGEHPSTSTTTAQLRIREA